MEAIHMISLKEVVGKTKENIVQRVPIDMIIPSPYQPRKTFSNSSLIELCQSIKQYGVLQPITVRKVGNGKYELIAGERRLRASKMAGLTLIPCMVIDADGRGFGNHRPYRESSTGGPAFYGGGPGTAESNN
jgi:hypothetical protein